MKTITPEGERGEREKREKEKREREERDSRNYVVSYLTPREFFLFFLLFKTNLKTFLLRFSLIDDIKKVLLEAIMLSLVKYSHTHTQTQNMLKPSRTVSSTNLCGK